MTVTTIEEAVVEKLRLLPQDKQREVLDFVRFFNRKPLPNILVARYWARWRI